MKHVINGKIIVYRRNGEYTSAVIEFTFVVCIPSGKDMVL